MLPIHSIETFWAHEWPWIRLVIFTQWCNFRCRYCENPDTIPYKATKFIDTPEIIELIKKEIPYFGQEWWITFSGWEPTIHAKKLIPICQEIKKLWVHITLDTNWSILNDDVKELLRYIDLVLPDIKHLNNLKHKWLTGKHNNPTIKFIKYLETIKKHFWVRHVLVPRYTNYTRHLKRLGRFLKKLKYLDRLEILPYHELWKHKRKELWRPYTLEDIKPDNRENVEKAKKILEKYIAKVIIR